MSTANPFDLLEDDDNDDLSRLVAKQQQKLVSKKLPGADPTASPAKRPSKPLPPAQFGKDDGGNFRDSDNAPRGRGRARGLRGRGRGGRGGSYGPNSDEGTDRLDNGFRGSNEGGWAIGDSEVAKESESQLGAYGGSQQRYPDRGQNDYGSRQRYPDRGQNDYGSRQRYPDRGQNDYGSRQRYPDRGQNDHSSRQRYPDGGQNDHGSGQRYPDPGKNDYGSRQRYPDSGQNNYGDRVGGSYERPPRRAYTRYDYNHDEEPKFEGGQSSNVDSAKDENVSQLKEITESTNIDKHLEENIVSAFEIDKVNEVVAKDVKEEPEDKEMTLDEYQKLLAEKRKNLIVVKTKGREIDVAKEFKSMQPLSIKKGDNEISSKASDKNSGKVKDSLERDDRVKKSVTIHEFLKPAEGESYYGPGARGRGRGRGRDRGGGRGRGDRWHVNDGRFSGGDAPSIEDHSEFPALGGK